jgi:hypothetical protein
MSSPGIPAAVAAQREEFAFSAAPPMTFPPAQWFCPVHRKSVIKPAGISKSSGKAYPAFWSCPEKVGETWCAEKPPKGFPVPHAEPIAHPQTEPPMFFPPMDLEEFGAMVAGRSRPASPPCGPTPRCHA